MKTIAKFKKIYMTSEATYHILLLSYSITYYFMVFRGKIIDISVWAPGPTNDFSAPPSPSLIEIHKIYKI